MYPERKVYEAFHKIVLDGVHELHAQTKPAPAFHNGRASTSAAAPPSALPRTSSPPALTHPPAASVPTPRPNINGTPPSSSITSSTSLLPPASNTLSPTRTRAPASSTTSSSTETPSSITAPKSPLISTSFLPTSSSTSFLCRLQKQPHTHHHPHLRQRPMSLYPLRAPRPVILNPLTSPAVPQGRSRLLNVRSTPHRPLLSCLPQVQCLLGISQLSTPLTRPKHVRCRRGNGRSPNKPHDGSEKTVNVVHHAESWEESQAAWASFSCC